MKEALRMHPGVGFPLERIVPASGARLCGVDLPAGTIVGMNAWVVHEDTEIFGEDAKDFRPERWIESPPDQLRLMDKHFLSVSLLPRDSSGSSCSKHSTVWTGSEDLHREAHLNHGDEYRGSTNIFEVRSGMGLE